MPAIAGITPAGLQRILDAGIAHGVLEPTSTLERLVPKPEYLELGGGAYERRSVKWSSAGVDHATTVGFVVYDPAAVVARPDLYDDDLDDGGGYDPHPGIVMCDYRCGAPEVPDPESLEQLAAAAEHWHRHSLAGGCSHGS